MNYGIGGNKNYYVCLPDTAEESFYGFRLQRYGKIVRNASFFRKKIREGGRKGFEGTGLATLGHLENPNPCQKRDCGKSSCCALGLFVKARLQHVANTS